MFRIHKVLTQNKMCASMKARLKQTAETITKRNNKMSKSNTTKTSKLDNAKNALVEFIKKAILYALIVVLAAFALQGVMSLIDGNETIRAIIATGFVSLLIFAVFKLSTEVKR